MPLSVKNAPFSDIKFHKNAPSIKENAPCQNCEKVNRAGMFNRMWRVSDIKEYIRNKFNRKTPGVNYTKGFYFRVL